VYFFYKLSIIQHVLIVTRHLIRWTTTICT